jgi:CRISPR/Cas system endoribonuclease Cas6 (RAMP superfamily)
MPDKLTTRRGLYIANRLAVPGTGKRASGHFFRYPRNVGVKRALLGIWGTLRGVSVPPNAYDDIAIAAARHRSWKRHRQTQWRIGING